MVTTLQPDASGWVPTYSDNFDAGWMSFYTDWGNRYSGQHANGAFSYNRDLVSIDNSMLTVTNARTATGWESGGVDQGFIGQRYGKYDIRARVEDGQGTSGAIILWPNSGRWPPEIDIMESPSADRSSVWFFYHGLTDTGGGQFNVDASDWHTYTLEWSPGKITWSVDGQLLAQTKDWEGNLVPDEPMTVSLTGFVASPSDTWWGTPNGSTPERVSMHVDYVNISALPLGERNQVAGTAFNGGAAPSSIAVGPVAVNGQLYAGAVNTGDWASIATAQAAPATWAANLSDRMAWTNVQQVQLDLRTAGSLPLDIMLLDVKGGSVSTGSGNDVVAWVAASDGAGAGNVLTIDSGAGNDAVRVGPAGWIGLDDSFLHSPTLDPWYEGGNSIASTSLGSGDDMLMAVGLVRLNANGGDGNDSMIGGASDDTLEGGAGNDTLKGSYGTDYAVYEGPRERFTVTQGEWGLTTVTDRTGVLGTDSLWDIERLVFSDTAIDLATGAVAAGPTQPPMTAILPPSPPTPPTEGAPQFVVVRGGLTGQEVAATYSGPVTYLQWQFLGTAAGEVVIASPGNDFVNLLAGDDAVNAGAGDDVIDGGSGSNFLTGGSGRDIFFLDGRGGEVSWATITDWQAGEELSLFGWRSGVSNAQWVEQAGAEGFKGVTMHADLDGNGIVDASVTWAGLTRSNLPSATEQEGLLWFHP